MPPRLLICAAMAVATLGTTLTERLAELEIAREKGLVSQTEYATLRKQVLGGFASSGRAAEARSGDARKQFNAKAARAAATATKQRAVAPEPLASNAQWNLVWADEFDALNLSTWKHELTAGGGGNWEFEYYTNNRTNSYVKNSTLFIRPTLTADRLDLTAGTLDLWGGSPADVCTSNDFYGCERNGANGLLNPIQSARLRSAESFSFTYGKVEIRAKLPRGDWIWPAIWMLPRDQYYAAWPSSGEIDIVESRGNAAGYAGGCDEFASTLHFGPYFGQDGYLKAHTSAKAPSGDFSQDFHVFGFVWTSEGMQTYLDDPTNIVLNVKTPPGGYYGFGDFPASSNDPWKGNGAPDAPFDRDFYFVMNVAVGGTNGYFPDGQGGKPWSDTGSTAFQDFWNAKAAWYSTWKGEDAAMQIDYIRVYQQKQQ